EPDEFGVKRTLFVSNGGVGFIPGRNEITSVIQVGLDPFGPAMENWFDTKTASAWPIKQAFVQDVGAFYVNTGRLCSIAWSWVTRQEATPDLYKVFVGTAENAHEESLHYQWREYCAGGLRFLLDNATDWFNPGGRDKRMYDSDNKAWVFGMAIGCGIGAWRCSYRDGVYRQSAGTYDRFDIRKVYGLNHELGCVGTPPLVVTQGDGESCYVTMYETTIRAALIRLRERQEYFLRHSLVCAYVRRGWDAFKDKALEELLGSMRQKLLEHPDRKLVDLGDVPRGETHHGRDWYEQLVEAGAGKTRHITRLAGAVGTIEPTDEPPPEVPGQD
ncbi:MAG: hypothetical protein KC636_09350, partial [Myxococcales bacterium]|nr:hypothetical protein [Myxococcales bacterium]